MVVTNIGLFLGSRGSHTSSELLSLETVASPPLQAPSWLQLLIAAPATLLCRMLPALGYAWSATARAVSRGGERPPPGILCPETNL